MAEIAVLKATLPLHPGINRTLHPRASGRGLYTDPAHKNWMTHAGFLLRAAGFKPEYPPKTPWKLQLDVFCSQRRDMDGIEKATIDAIATAIGVNDCYLNWKLTTKTVVRKEEHRIEVTLYPERMVPQ